MVTAPAITMLAMADTTIMNDIKRRKVCQKGSYRKLRLRLEVIGSYQTYVLYIEYQHYCQITFF